VTPEQPQPSGPRPPDLQLVSDLAKYLRVGAMNAVEARAALIAGQLPHRFQVRPDLPDFQPAPPLGPPEPIEPPSRNGHSQ
jgi:hypothetical protein